MARIKRSAFQQEVANALIESGAINLDQVGATLSTFGKQAFLEGEDLVHIINRNIMWNCGWPVPFLEEIGGEIGRPGVG